MEANSPEEAEALAQMEALVIESGDADAIAADKETKLLCLRGRKYVPEAGATVLSKLFAIKKELGLDGTMDAESAELLRQTCAQRNSSPPGKRTRRAAWSCSCACATMIQSNSSPSTWPAS